VIVWKAAPLDGYNAGRGAALRYVAPLKQDKLFQLAYLNGRGLTSSDRVPNAAAH
jgi:hypothetical protein